MKRALASALLLAAPAWAQDSAGVAFFETKVRPILARNCYACHSAEAPAVQGALRVDSPELLLAGGNAGPPIVPGKPERSLLMRFLSHEDEIKMPPGGKLAEEHLAAIGEWIRMGAPVPAVHLRAFAWIWKSRWSCVQDA